MRQIDVGVLSRLPIAEVRSHLDDLDPQPSNPRHPYLYSRDCLEVSVELAGSRKVTLFVNHFASKYAEGDTQEERAAARKRKDEHRRRQAEGVAKLLRERYPGSQYDTEWFAVVGDLNDEPASEPLHPLTRDAGLHDVLERLKPEEQRWTHWWRSENSASQMDYMLLSPALAEATNGTLPHVERHGVSYGRDLKDGGIGPKTTEFQHVEGDPNPVEIDFTFERFANVTTQAYASDHCPVFIDLP